MNAIQFELLLNGKFNKIHPTSIGRKYISVFLRKTFYSIRNFEQ